MMPGMTTTTTTKRARALREELGAMARRVADLEAEREVLRQAIATEADRRRKAELEMRRTQELEQTCKALLKRSLDLQDRLTERVLRMLEAQDARLNDQ